MSRGVGKKVTPSMKYAVILGYSKTKSNMTIEK